MRQVTDVLDSIILDEILFDDRGRDLFTHWCVRVFDKYQKIKGLSISSITDDTCQQYLNVEDALELIYRRNDQLVRHIYNSYFFVDNKFESFKNSPELPIEIIKTRNNDFLRLKNEILSLNQKDSLDRTIYLDICWTLWAQITENLLLKFHRLHPINKSDLRSVHTTELAVLVLEATHTPAKNLMRYWDMYVKKAG